MCKPILGQDTNSKLQKNVSCATNQGQGQDDLDESDYGTCLVRFIVDTNGVVSHVKAMTMQGSHMAKIGVDAIIHGPKWIPAMQNGIRVKAYRIQPITLINPG